VSLLPPILIALAALVIAWRWSSRAPVSTVACARCVHDARQLDGSRCPECGADLRTSGVLTPAMGRTVIVPRRTIVRLVAVVVGAGWLGFVAWRVADRGPLADGRRISRTLSVGQPASGAFSSFTLEGERTIRDGRIRFGPHCLRVVQLDGSRSEPLCVLPPPRPVPSGGSMSGAPVISADELPLERVLQWGRSIGLDPDDPAIRIELTDMHRIATRSIRDDDLVTGVPLDGFPRNVTVATGLRPAPMPGAAALGAGVGLVLLVPGLLGIRRLRTTTRLARQEAARSHLAGSGPGVTPTPESCPF
jgi:hypothetical protein